MRLIFSITLLLFSAVGWAQADETDSCAIAPAHTAVIQGLDKKGILSMDDISKIKRLVAEDKEVSILRFTFSVDCDGCEMDIYEVYADTLSAEDLKRLAAIKPRQVLSFDCIVGKNKKGDLVTCKPFLFYIRP